MQPKLFYIARQVYSPAFCRKNTKKSYAPHAKSKSCKNTRGAKNCRTINIMSNCQALRPPCPLGALPERAPTQGAGRGASLAFLPLLPLSILGGGLSLGAWGLGRPSSGGGLLDYSGIFLRGFFVSAGNGGAQKMHGLFRFTI